MGTIVVGVDRSAGAAHALQWAAEEARLRGDGLRAVLAWSFLDQHHSDPDAPFDPHYGEANAREALDAYVERALGADAASSIERTVVCDLGAPALLSAISAETPLVVVGARGLGGFRGLLVGSVSQQVLNHAPCPVAIIRDGDPAPGAAPRGRVVVGVDGSPDSLRALRVALDEAVARQATLEVVHSWLPPAVGLGGLSSPGYDLGALEASARELLDSAIEGEDTSGLPHPPELSLVQDTPAVALLAAAEEADVVVVGARGLGGVARAVLGSVSNRIVHHTTRPVIVVPPPIEH